MGFPPPYVHKTEKNSTTRPLPYVPATNPGHWSDSTRRPIGRRVGAICWLPLPGGYGDDYRDRALVASQYSLFRACCKSKTSTQVPSTLLSQFWKGKKQNRPHIVSQNWKIIFWGGRISKFHAGAGIKQNQRSLPFPRTTKMNILGHHYFAQKYPETQIKFKPKWPPR